MNIYVSNLAFNIQDDELRNLFEPFGAVSSAKIINDRDTGRSRGFGFVEMEDDNAAREAIAQLDQSTLDGRTMNVAEAKPKGENHSIKPFQKRSRLFKAQMGNSSETGFVPTHEPLSLFPGSNRFLFHVLLVRLLISY